MVVTPTHGEPADALGAEGQLMSGAAYRPRNYVDPTVNRPEVLFTVPGEPVSKSRHKTGIRGGRVHHYADGKNVQAQAAVGFYYRQARGPGVAAEGGFGVAAEFHVKARQRRDIDNMLKLVFDGLTGFAWIDDSQVTEVHARLIHGADNPRSEIRVYPTDDLPDWNTKKCQFCGENFRTYDSWSKVKFCSPECLSSWRRNRCERTCLHCGSTFRSSKHETPPKFCSRECSYQHKKVARVCATCGKAYTIARSLSRAGKGFCGRECREKFWRENQKVAARGTCSICGGPTSKKSYLRCNACKLAGKTVAS